MAVKEIFQVEYEAKEGVTIPAIFRTSPSSKYNTTIKGKDEDEARDYFNKFYPNAQIVSIKKQN